MPTIIDSLLVTLGLDSSDYDKGRKGVDDGLKKTGDEADKTGDKLEKTGKKAASGMGAAGKAVAGFLAIIGGTMAIKRFVADTIESSAALERFSKNAGASAETVSAWSNAAEIAGGSASGMQSTIDMLSRSQTELQLTGQTGILPYLATLGVAIADANGKARPFDDMLLDLADKFAKLDRPTAFNMGRSMGIDGETMNLLLKGRAAVEASIAKQKEFGAVSAEQAAQSEALREETAALKNGFVAFARDLLGTAMPALAGITGALGRGLGWMRQHQQFVKTFFGVLTAGLVGATAAATAFSVATSPITLAVLGFVALAAAIAALWEDYETWKKGGDSLIDWSKWEPGITAAIEGAKALASGFGSAFTNLRQWSGDAADAIKSRWESLTAWLTGIGDRIGAAWRSAKRAVGLDAPEPAPKAPASAAPVPQVAPAAPQPRPEPASAAPVPQVAPAAPLPRPEPARIAPTPQAAPVPAQAAASPRPGNPALPRGIRNNNPGNLNFANQAGATKESGPNGRFAVFGSMAEGIAAMVRQLGLYINRDGLNTIRKIVSKYAPPTVNGKFENDTGAYIAAVSQAVGIGPDDPIDQNNVNHIKGLVRAIVDHENGGAQKVRPLVTDDHISQGFDLAKRPRPATAGIPQAAANVPKVAPGQGASVAAVAAAGPKAPQPAPSTVSNETKIGEIKVFTQAKDADGIARDIGNRLDFAFASQANSGLF